jgi:hypothetical protein
MVETRDIALPEVLSAGSAQQVRILVMEALSDIRGKYLLPSLPLGCLLLDYGSLVPSPSLFFGGSLQAQAPGSCLSKPIRLHLWSANSPPKILTCPVLRLSRSRHSPTLPVSSHCNSLSLQGPCLLPIALRISSIPSFPFRSPSLTLDLALCRTPIFSSSFSRHVFRTFTGFSSFWLRFAFLCWVFPFLSRYLQ